MESLAEDLRTMIRRPLAESHVAALRAAGTERAFEAGTMIVRPGDPIDSLLLVEAGEIEIVDRPDAATLGPGQFAGETSFLSGGRYLLAMRAVEDSRVLFVPRQAVLDLMARIPEMSDILVSVFAARRRRMIEEGFGGVTLIGDEADRAVRDLAGFATRNRIPMRIVEPGSEPAMALAASCGTDGTAMRAVYGDSQVLEDPSPETLARAMGIEMPTECSAPVDLLVVGAGPAGIAAAVYGASEGLDTLVVEDTALGGQAGTSSRIENYMGFPTGISGADLAWRGQVQAMKFGARFAMPRRAVSFMRQEDGLFRVELNDGAHVRAGAVVVAAGVQYRRLPIEGLETLEGTGVYYAATELEARFCRGSEVAVIGGGNSAGQAAMHLCRTARHVHLLVRGPSLAVSMSDYLLKRLEADPGVTIHYRTEMTAVHGAESLSGITIRDRDGGTEREIDARAVFVMVGAAPNTGWLDGHVDLDGKGFVLTGEAVGARSPYATSMPGVFAVGDVRSASVKRVASATGEGSVVVSKVWEHLNPAS